MLRKITVGMSHTLRWSPDAACVCRSILPRRVRRSLDGSCQLARLHVTLSARKSSTRKPGVSGICRRAFPTRGSQQHRQRGASAHVHELAAQMMILIKEKANCAASKGGAPELKTSMSRGCIHFCSKPLLKCCHQTAIYESCSGVLEKEENVTEDFGGIKI